MLAGRPDLSDEPYVQDWAKRDWPLIACRPPDGASPDTVAAGLALPPQAGKKRLSVQLSPNSIVKLAPPPSLINAAAAAPPNWQSWIAALLRAAPGVGVFGSLAWQHATGLPYLTPASDLDLLLTHQDRDGSEALLRRIAMVAATAPMRIDGELVRNDGAAVQWRELFDGAAEVLVKRMEGVGPMARSEFLA
jgi:phosphoribosyl-dephospho-CoA transferase